MFKTFTRFAFIFVICLFLVSWGSVGHQIISKKAPDSFPSVMTGFGVWSDSLRLHASDADNRKSADPTESPKHFIDIDNYTEFRSTGRIVSTYDSLVSLHGATTVSKNGILPYATRNTYDSLKNCFKKLQWHKAMLFASDLGHYVGDGHMPMHLTANYDGGSTGNNGIHSRYESDMVGAYQTNLNNYTGSSVTHVSNINNYVFTYIYRNYHYVDSVIIADNYAKGIDATYGTAYTTALWSKTQFTTTLFKNASHALAELIYSAWVDAGSPVFGSKTFPSAVNSPKSINVSVYPNPTRGIVNLIGEDDIYKAEVTSIDGKVVGSYAVKQFDLSHLSKGVYVLSIYSKEGLVQKEKLLIVN